MQVFVYEFVTGSGGEELPASLLAEGQAMVAAVTADFARIDGATVVTTRSERLPPLHDPRCRVTTIRSVAEEHDTFHRLAAQADWTLVIAPESAGVLLERSQWVISAGGRLLSPGPAAIALAGDKDATCRHLRGAGIATPSGCVLTSASTLPRDVGFPAVIKPLNGCGSQGMRRIENHAELCDLALDEPQRLEQFVPGLPASASVLCGPSFLVPLPACEQLLSADSRFTYLGGRLPLASDLEGRARELAVAAVKTLPDPLGYIGVDLVLGKQSDGSGDTVIEINPRLTTSYVGLRAFCRENLAAAMLAVCGGTRPALSWRAGGLQFSADGRVETMGGHRMREAAR